MRGTGEIHLVGSTTLNADIPVAGIVMGYICNPRDLHVSFRDDAGWNALTALRQCDGELSKVASLCASVKMCRDSNIHSVG